MQDNKQPIFTPNTPEKRISMDITAREAHLIKELRKFQFGKIMVYKANGILIRIEPNESILINEESGLNDLIDRH